jgi:hypothetical protein
VDIDDFVAVSARETVSCKGSADAVKCLEAFLDDLLGELAGEGCRVIGHIKGMMACDGEEPLFFSLTSFDARPRIQGCQPGGGSDYVLAMNIIVSDVGKPWLTDTLYALLARHFEIGS